MDQIDIKSYTFEQLEAFVLQMGEKKFRAKQIYQWLHVRGVTDFSEMTDLSAALRERLAKECRLCMLTLVTVQQSALDGTRKYLFELEDGNRIESVLMRYHHGNSVCVSSQAGCRMGCSFCASTLDGLVRNLTPAEILDQIYRISADIGERISNVVVMGTGEPMDNYENVVQFLHMISDEHGLNISQRNLTVSTCGIVPGILRLAKEHLNITLALSLHASTQEKRAKLMPVAKAYPLDQVLEACDAYFAETGRRVTFEYSLIVGVNDSDQDARQLHQILGGKNCHVNLIPVNPIKERDYRAPAMQAVSTFKNKLEKYGINVTIRREMGRDIDGACGQLRKRYAER